MRDKLSLDYNWMRMSVGDYGGILLNNAPLPRFVSENNSSLLISSWFRRSSASSAKQDLRKTLIDRNKCFSKSIPTWITQDLNDHFFLNLEYILLAMSKLWHPCWKWNKTPISYFGVPRLPLKSFGFRCFLFSAISYAQLKSAILTWPEWARWKLPGLMSK